VNRESPDPQIDPQVDPRTGVKDISATEFAKKVAEQIHDSSNGHHPPSGFYETHEASDREKEAEEASNAQPPSDMDAEAAVLAAVLLDPTALPKIQDILQPEHFHSESHGLIHRACLSVYNEGRPIDVVTVATRLRSLDRLGQAGGMAYLTQILNSTPAVLHVRSHAESIVTLAARRSLIAACVQAKIIFFDQEDPTKAIEFLRSRIDSFRPKQSFQTPKDVIKQWSEDGPLIHEPTGIPPLDHATGGGPVYGSRWIVNGAPDAGKTALLVQIAHTYALRGVAVGFLAADEESSDLQTRFAQRSEFSRLDCEIRNPNTLGLMQEAMGGLPVRFYRADMTIEAVSDDLALWARQRGSQAALFVDSIQTVVCAKVLGTEDISTRELVTENVRALKNSSMRHKIISLATSEMNRSAYRNGNGTDQNDMASGAESRAIEYLARVLVTLRSVKDEPDLVEVAIPKNKHGRSGENFFLRIDRKRMTLFESEGPSAPDEEAAKEDEKAVKERLAAEAVAAREAASVSAKQEIYLKEEALLLSVVAEQPGIGTHDLRAAMSAKLGGCGRSRVDDCVARLGKKLRVEPGPRGAKNYYLN
jgi:replicative DNA helicase